MSVQTMTTLSRILVPTDFSEHSKSAVSYACDLASDAEAELHIVHVARAALSATEEQELVQRMSLLLSAQHELSLATLKYVGHGKPDQVIAEYAREHDIDMVVMGTHGRTGWAHLTMGSVAEDVVRTAPCPVVVLGPGDAQSVDVSHATGVLKQEIGQGLEADWETGRARLLNALVQELRIPSTSAIRVLDEMLDREQLTHSAGHWHVQANAFETNTDFNSLVSESTDSHAVDLLIRASKSRATDVHLDPCDKDEFLIRFRVDGRLQEFCRMNRSIADHLCNQLKTMAGLSVTEPFRAMEGRLKLPEKLAHMEVRLTSVPVAAGQAVALRLFDPQKVFLPLDHLGFSTDTANRVEALLTRGEGLILVTGPSGSGKTTTVYSMLSTLGGVQHNIVSIEDPVEFSAPFVRQLSVDEQHGLSMADGLRTLLRMDPDVMFIGEIRDSHAARIGLQAATSGKYVFSTMHTRNIASTISSLQHLGLEDRGIASNLAGVINQRLALRLCAHCKQPVEPSEKQAETFRLNGVDVPPSIYTAQGCQRCRGSGYRGRIGVFEVAGLDRTLQQAIVDRKSDQAFADLLRELHIPDLQTDALGKVAEGVISFQDAVIVPCVG